MTKVLSLNRPGSGPSVSLQEKGLYDALEALEDPAHGFLDLKGSGLHVIGFTQAGAVFLDTSGQMKPGMDMSRHFRPGREEAAAPIH